MGLFKKVMLWRLQVIAIKLLRQRYINDNIQIMRTQMMIKKEHLPFRFSGRVICFLFIVFSILSFGQSFSVENPAVYVQEGTVITLNYKQEDSTVQTDKNRSTGLTTFTGVIGEEYIYIAADIPLSGINQKSINRIAKKETAASLPQKRSIAENKSVRKKNVTGNSLTSRKSISAFPEQNAVHYISVSGQAVCAAPGNHHQNLIYYQQIQYISAGQPDEYIPENYYFLFSAFSSNCIGAGGIRPPPFHC
ncbi:hypothetical protein [Chryseobacterium salviniae]|uniref:Uncharacterized protein n=1 Tax=Chryseobacterium salviniae TaxID=3101750 RepID=A0ABU6HPS6_9FLAO|nr:hypothetical protein [Chryseobacterium sp. T9W2-O]MEC3875055.1 hypothetical protein [Chryseobacterium sp. T9W2-O]